MDKLIRRMKDVPDSGAFFFLHLKRYVIIISLYPVQLHSILLLI